MFNNNRYDYAPRSAKLCASCSTSTGSPPPAPSSPPQTGQLSLAT